MCSTVTSVGSKLKPKYTTDGFNYLATRLTFLAQRNSEDVDEA